MNKYYFIKGREPQKITQEVYFVETPLKAFEKFTKDFPESEIMIFSEIK